MPRAQPWHVQAVRAVVAKLAAAGAVNDTAYAESRALSPETCRSFTASGDSIISPRRGSVPKSRVRSAPNDDASELWRPRLSLRDGVVWAPFRVGAKPDAAGYRRELAVLARAGFPQAVASRALSIDPHQAEALVNQFASLIGRVAVVGGTVIAVGTVSAAAIGCP